MARKLMTFLGTGKYELCHYGLEGAPSRLVRYVQLALADLLKPDRVIVFTTPAAYEANYIGDEGLFAAARSARMDHLFTCVEIAAGKSVQEIWDTFKLIYGNVEAGDAVIFDITHSFRSIPVMGLACLQYARTLRNVVLEAIYYGAYEARDRETNISPVLDLTPFVDLMEWSQAVSELVKFGHCGALGHRVRSGTAGPKSKQKNLLTTLAGDLERTGIAIAGCRGKAIFLDPPWENIPRHLKKLRNQDDPVLTAFEPLLDVIENQVADLRMEGIAASQEVQRGLGAVRWCLRHDLVQQAYSILQETMITHVCQVAGLNFKDDVDRQLVSQCPKVATLPVEEWKGPAGERRECAQGVLECARPEILDLLGDFSGWRNIVMHCKLKSDKDFKTLKEKVERTFGRFLELLNAHETSGA